MDEISVAGSRGEASRVAIVIACVVLGIGVGFAVGRGLVSGAHALFHQHFHDERSAAVNHPVTVERPAFRFQHPGNWRVDDQSRKYDPDHLFTIHSPGNSFILIAIDDAGTEPQDLLDRHVEAQTTKVMKNPQRTPFTQWGAYRGVGMLLTGKHLGFKSGTIRIFAFREHGKSFTVVQSTFDDDRADVQPGFDLVERSFHVKRPSPRDTARGPEPAMSPPVPGSPDIQRPGEQ
jgi:hypothetical protein